MTGDPPGGGRGLPSGKELLSALGAAVAIFDPEAMLIEVTPAFIALNPALSGFLVPGAGWDILLHEAERQAGYPPDLCAALCRAEQSLRDPGNHQIVEGTMPGGRSFTFRLAALADEGFLLAQSAAADHGQIDAVREAEALLRKVLEASPVSLTMSRVGDGQVIYRSPAATELLGTAKSSSTHFARRTERADFITALLPNGQVDDVVVTGIRGDQTEFPARISARLIDFQGEEVVVSSIEDLTAERAVEAELARNREQLFQAEKMSALGELLAGVSHELNNPLSIIVGNAGILREDLAETPHAKRIDRLIAAGQRCVGIVRSFLSMARERPLELAVIPFHELAANITEATAELAQSAGVALSVESAADLPPLRADRVQMAQVLINLVTNAIQAIRESRTGSAVTISAVSERPGWITLRVVDDGPGIDPAIRGRIFDPLFTTKAPGEGTGFGLALCMRVVSAHKGSITLDPKKGPGAAFSVDLPTV